MKQIVRVGLIGFGTVGTGVASLLFGKGKPFLKGRAYDLELVKIADLDITRDRGVSVPEGVLTTDVREVLDNPDIDIVIELIGGYEPALTFTLRAFANGKSVVTANKAWIFGTCRILSGMAGAYFRRKKSTLPLSSSPFVSRPVLMPWKSWVVCRISMTRSQVSWPLK